MKIPQNKFLRAILFPHFAFLLTFIPFSLAFLIYSLVFADVNSALAYISYALAFYSVMTFCLRIPAIAKKINTLRSENRIFTKLKQDLRFRITVSLYGALILNTAYALFQLGLGFYHTSLWYFAMAFYYMLLALIRFFLLRYTRVFEASSNIRSELKRYALTGVVLLIMNIALGIIIFYIVAGGIRFVHHEITTIALAAYTFWAFTVSIINAVKYKKYNSPVFSASKTISLTAAVVSMLTLEATMLSTFGEGNASFNTAMLALSGAVIFLFIGIMAIYMIISAARKFKQFQEKTNDPTQQK